jgi:SAM-dependent methyltransferase
MTQSDRDVGLETLERVSTALTRYNAWLAEIVTPFLSGRVLEVGAGIGNLSEFFVGHGDVCLTDTSESYLATLRRRFANDPRVRVYRWDISEDSPPELELDAFDAIACLNVLEHVEDDSAALSRMLRLLAPGGRLVLLVPAGSLLYNEFDRALGHYRRYSSRALRGLLVERGFAVDRVWHFNPVGIAGWFLNGYLLRKRILPAGQMRLLDRSVPLLRALQRLNPPIGISLIAVARKR